jgi:hypothetical protein
MLSSLEKFAMVRAVARTAPRCADRLIISEVNWPLSGTGVYSPVGSPYVSPGVRHNDPSVSEARYARYMIRYLLIAVCSGMVDRVYWWRLVARGFGLVDDTEPDVWRKRPAYAALQTFLRLAGPATFLRKLEGDDGAEYFLFARPEGTRMCVAYVPRGEVEPRLPFEFAHALDIRGTLLSDDDAERRLSGDPVYFVGVTEEGAT